MCIRVAIDLNNNNKQPTKYIWILKMYIIIYYIMIL